MLKIGTKQRLSQVMNSVTRQTKNINSGLEQNTFLCQYGRKEYKIDLNYAFIVQGRHVVFIKSKCITLIAQKSAIIH